MANSQTERELQCLHMETNEDRLTPHEGMRQLQGRAVATPPPVLPPRSRSVPVDETPQPFSVWRHTPLPQNTTEHSSAGLDTTDADSISNRLILQQTN